MPKENRFAGLGEAMEATENGDAEEEAGESNETAEVENRDEGGVVASTDSKPVSAERVVDEPRKEGDDTETERGEPTEEASTDEPPSEQTTEPTEDEGSSPTEQSESRTEKERNEPRTEEVSRDTDAEGPKDIATEAPEEKDVGESSGADGETSEDDEGGPAFEFEATTAKSIYVRTETLDQMDDAEFEVEALLRREHDIRDLTGREFHDALVRIAATYPDEIAETIVQTRND